MCVWLNLERHPNPQYLGTSAHTLRRKNQEEQSVWAKQEVGKPQWDSFEEVSEEEILSSSAPPLGRCKKN